MGIFMNTNYRTFAHPSPIFGLCRRKLERSNAVSMCTHFLIYGVDWSIKFIATDDLK